MKPLVPSVAATAVAAGCAFAPAASFAAEVPRQSYVTRQLQLRTFGPNYGAGGQQPFFRVFFTDPYPAAALTEERILRTALPGTRLFGAIAAGQNHLARAFSISSSGKYFGGRL